MMNLLVLKAEVKRWLILVKRYPISFIASAGSLYLIFLGMFFGSGSARRDPMVMADVLVGYLMWIFVFSALGDFSDLIIDESLTGTYEQLCINQVSIMWILFCRALTRLFTSLLIIITNLLIITVTTGIKLNLNFIPVLVILGLSILGLYGFGFMLAALALIFKRIGPVVSVLQYIFLFLTGAIISLENFPKIIKAIGESLPLTAGIEAMRMSAVAQIPLREIVNTPIFGNLLLSAVIYIFLGAITFIAADNYGKKKGLLGQY